MNWSGPYGGNSKMADKTKGVMRARRQVKREEAEARNAKTPEDRRRKNRLSE